MYVENSPPAVLIHSLIAFRTWITVTRNTLCVPAGSALLYCHMCGRGSGQPSVAYNKNEHPSTICDDMRAQILLVMAVAGCLFVSLGESCGRDLFWSVDVTWATK